MKKKDIPIGAVTKMTGITSHTLRKWESRYSLVTPERTDTGRRMYDSEDITRLVAVRELVNQGFLPSRLSKMTTKELQEIIRREQPNAGTLVRKGVINVIGPVLSSQFRQHPTSPNIIINEHHGTPEDWLKSRQNTNDSTILECPSVSTKLVTEILTQKFIEPALITIVYGFASRRSIRRLRNVGITCLQAPIQVTDLIETEHFQSTPPKRSYTDNQISELLTLVPSIECECPNHIGQLLIGLNAFEKYSQECENATPSDKALHSSLVELTGHARGLMEKAADLVVEAEGISFQMES